MNTSKHFVILLVVFPLLAATIAPLVGKKRKKFVAYWAIFWTSLTAMVALYLTVFSYPFNSLKKTEITYIIGNWPRPYGIEIRFDQFSTSSLVITGLTLLILIYSLRYIEKSLPENKITPYYTLVLLLITGMNGFVITGDLFNLFVFLEILSLSSYALTAISGTKLAEMAAFKYLIVGALSSVCILLAIALLYSITGSLNMIDIGRQISVINPSKLVLVMSFALFAIGFSVKSAIFPLHIWLPDAHSIAPSSVSALLSGIVVKIGILGIIRILWIFRMADNAINLKAFLNLFVWLGGISIIMGAFFAFFQNDIKLMLAYSTISNIGYISMGIGLFSHFSLLGAVIHIFNHAIIKTTLFLCAGSIIYRTGYRLLSDLRGVAKNMPVTLGSLAIGAVSIVGIPPTSGFICKWYIALGALEANRIFFAIILLFGALLIFGYYIKIINTAYFKQPLTKDKLKGVKESPLSMTIPIGILAVLCIVFGVGAIIPISYIDPAVKALLA